MDTIEVTIQRFTQEGWPVAVEWTAAEALPVRVEGILRLDVNEISAFVDPRRYGTVLGEGLFRDGHIRSIFERARERAEGPLHFLLVVEDPQLKTMRWERLCAPVGETWNFLLLDQGTPLSLYIPTSVAGTFPPIGRADLRALVVAASPEGLQEKGLAPFDVSATVDGIRRSLGDIPFDVLATTEGAAGPPTMDILAERLTAPGYPILHLVCHGIYRKDGETAVFLANDRGRADPIPATLLIDRLQRIDQRAKLPRLAFLATCDSAAPAAEGAMGGLAQRMVRELGIPAVVGMTDRVLLTTAESLAGTFYGHLFAHGQVDLALAQAYAGLDPRKHSIAVPTLFSRLGGRALFSESLRRALGPSDIDHGLARLGELLKDRAPILLQRFLRQATVIRAAMGTEASALAEVARDERVQALEEIEKICTEATELDFHALALHREPPPFDRREPFRGLHPFRPEDREFFFGRDELVDRLRRRLEEHNFLAVLGPSGSGKSSVVLAGLVPALARHEPNLKHAYITPGSDPAAQLQAALDSESRHQLLVVDQFEELFTLTPEDKRGGFITGLLKTAEKCRVVITMRADFWGECAVHRSLAEVMQARQDLIGPMTITELRRAIELQAAEAGLRFESDLLYAMLDDVEGEPGAMPLLQHALHELWKRRHGRWLRADEYRVIGGVRGAIAKTADELFRGLSAEEKEEVRDVFVRLTRLDEMTEEGAERRDTRQRVPVDELAGKNLDATKRLIKRLGHLVVTSWNQVHQRDEVEVAHEALIRYWPRLQEWLEEDRNAYLLRQRIRDAAKDWQSASNDDSLLILRGSRLREAESLIETGSPRFALNEVERKYVEACTRLREREAAQAREWKHTVALHQIEADVRTQPAMLHTRPVDGLLLAVEAMGKNLQELPEEILASVQTAIRLGVDVAREQNIMGGEGRLWSVAFSPDGAVLALGGDDGAIRLWDRRGNPVGEPLRGHKGAVFTLAFSPDGGVLISGGQDGKLRLRDTKGSFERDLTPRHEGPVWSVAFAPGGDLVGSGGNDGIVRLWDRHRLSAEATFPSGQAAVRSIAFSPDGEILASGGADGTIRLWDRRGNPLGKAFRGHPTVFSVAFSPDGEVLASGGADGTIRLWDRRGNPLGEAFRGHRGAVRSLAFSRSGLTIASAGIDRTVRLWERESEPRMHELSGHTAPVRSVAFSPEGEILASAGLDGTVRLWDLRGSSIGEPRIGHIGAVRSVAFSPSEGVLASGGEDGTVRLWDREGNSVGDPLPGPDGTVWCVSFSRDGQILAAGADNGTVQLRDRAGGMIGQLSKEHRGPVRSVAFSPRGTIVASGGEDGTVRLWNSRRDPIGTRSPGHRGPALSVVFSPDGMIVASSGFDGTVRLWDRKGNPMDEHFVPHDGVPIFSLAFSPDGQFLASAGMDGTVRMSDRKGALIGKPLSGHRGSVFSVAFSPNGEILASAGLDGTVRLWNQKGDPIGQALSGHKGRVLSVAFSPDGEIVASAGEDGTVRLWRGGDSRAWLRLAGDRLRFHPILRHPQTELARTARDVCEEFVWKLEG